MCYINVVSGFTLFFKCKLKCFIYFYANVTLDCVIYLTFSEWYSIFHANFKQRTLFSLTYHSIFTHISLYFHSHITLFSLTYHSIFTHTSTTLKTIVTTSHSCFTTHCSLINPINVSKHTRYALNFYSPIKRLINGSIFNEQMSHC